LCDDHLYVSLKIAFLKNQLEVLKNETNDLELKVGELRFFHTFHIFLFSPSCSMNPSSGQYPYVKQLWDKKLKEVKEQEEMIENQTMEAQRIENEIVTNLSALSEEEKLLDDLQNEAEEAEYSYLMQAAEVKCVEGFDHSFSDLFFTALTLLSIILLIIFPSP
jgi:hypothetical protein